MKLHQLTPGSIVQEWDAYGNVTETETSVCAHCQYITNIPSRRRMHEVVDICRQCMKLICLECADKPCSPFLKKIEEQEERDYRARMGTL